MKTSVQVWSYLARLLVEWKIFLTKFVDKFCISELFSKTFQENSRFIKM